MTCHIATFKEPKKKRWHVIWRAKCLCGVTQCAFSDMNDVCVEKKERDGKGMPGGKTAAGLTTVCLV